jgi:opacity protein-like surface antigen
MNRLSIIPLVSVLAANSFAADNFGISYSNVDTDALGLKPSMISAHFEKEVNPNVRVEGRFSIGLSDDEVYYDGAYVSAEIDHAIGAHLKLSPDFNADVAPYVSIGYTSAKASASASTGSYSVEASETDSDAMLGAGLRVKLDETATGFFEIGTFDDADILSFGLLFKM